MTQSSKKMGIRIYLGAAVRGAAIAASGVVGRAASCWLAVGAVHVILVAAVVIRPRGACRDWSCTKCNQTCKPLMIPVKQPHYP